MANASLLTLIANHFNDAELRVVTFEMAIDYEDLPALGKSGKIIELIRYCYRYGYLPRLLTILARERSHVNWPDPSQPHNMDFLLGKETVPLLPYEPETVVVPAGSFKMGTDLHLDEAPQHEVALQAYLIGKYPVTNQQYFEFIRQTKRPVPNKQDWFLGQPVKQRQDFPVVGVSWYDALAYCVWLSRHTGKTYRLPTEAEWEKAARGEDGRLYPWGNSWETDRCNQGNVKLTAVTAYDQHLSPYGCADVVGNTQQWTSTLWGSDHRQCSYPYPYRHDEREMLETEDGRFRLRRIYRGSTFMASVQQCRLSVRGHDRPQKATSTRGFRVVMEP